MIRFASRPRPRGRWHRVFAPSSSPAGLAGWGILMAVAYGVVHALGWREHTGFLSLTASPGLSLGETTPRGTVYLLLHFGAVLGTPSLLLAGLLLRIWVHFIPTKRSGSPVT